MSEGEIENLKRKVEELEKKTESIVMVINMTNQVFMKLFDRMMANTISLLEQLPERTAKLAVKQLKEDFENTVEILENARKNSYVS